MYGAFLGDIIGSPYEFDRGSKTKDFPLFIEESAFTDDSVMTAAVAEALMDAGKDADTEAIIAAVTESMQRWGREYPDAGYGARFIGWLDAKHPRPYNSCGNGSAMRVSAAGWLYDSLERTREAARATALPTHNHPEGIKGAEATAAAIYMARTGSAKAEIRDYLTREFGYDLSRTLDEIRPGYHHVETCQQTVPEAVTAFLEAESFEDAIRNAVSLGGDCDTLGAITSSIAEAFYGVPITLIAECLDRIDPALTAVLERFNAAIGRGRQAEAQEDPYQENQVLRDAAAAFMLHREEESGVNHLFALLDRIIGRMLAGGIAPMTFVDKEGTLLKYVDPDTLTLGDTVHIDEEVHLVPDTVQDSSGGVWFPLYPDDAAIEAGDSMANVNMPVDIAYIIEEGLSREDLQGVILDPFGTPITLTKQALELIMQIYRQEKANAAENGES